MHNKYSVVPFIDDFLDNSDALDMTQNISNNNEVNILCWNIANPSLKRARKQVLWLKKQNFNVIILTETKDSKGCDFIVNYLKYMDYIVENTKPENGEYGVIIASKIHFNKSPLNNKIQYVKSRFLSIRLKNSWEIIGMYIPSKGDNSIERIEKKRRFIQHISETLSENIPQEKCIICGDFNVIEPNHIPRYNKFDDWEYNFYSKLISLKMEDAYRIKNPEKNEYSWVGRTGDGYRYDHCFISKDLSVLLKKCFYDHEPRYKKLSDHSCLIMSLKIL